MTRIACIVGSLAFAMALPFAGVADTIPLMNLDDMSTGGYHTCALPSSGGGVLCWGYNNVGQLGDGTTNSRIKPAVVPGLTGVYSSITTGSYHTCVVTATNGIKCWGSNASGQLGDGSQANRSTPVDVQVFTTDAVTVSAGLNHTCALTSSGGVKCWGGNESGQLGDGTQTMRLTPTDVVGLQSGVSDVKAGDGYSCALISGGGVKCWGRNSSGQLGDGTGAMQTSPVDVVGLSGGVNFIYVNKYGAHTCATMSTTWSVKCWGDNTYGQFGDGTNFNTSTTPRDIPIAAYDVGLGSSHSCFMLPAGNMKCAGFDTQGQLGDNGGGSSIVPVDVYELNYYNNKVSVAQNTSCALHDNGLRCWGFNGLGQAGDGTTINRLFPVAAKRERVDFNADSYADIVWRNSSDGSVLQWLMNGTTLVQQASLAGPGATAQPIHIADFNGDGKADILWRDADGSVTLTLMDGGTVIASATLVGPGTGWSVTHVGDFNADGMADLLWTHTDGSVQVWLMDGTTAAATFGYVSAGSGWSVIHVGDMNGDGFDDILWQHADGTVLAWFMGGGTPSSPSAISSFAAAGSGWTVSHLADLDGDGVKDLIWTHSDGSVQLWLMSFISIPKQVNSVVPAGTGWVPTHTGDLNGDGREDIVWRYPDGTVLIWLMDVNNTVQSVASVTGAGNQYAVTHVRDLDGDGRADILWQHPDGTVQAWLMNGTQPSSIAQIVGPGTYSIVP